MIKAISEYTILLSLSIYGLSDCTDSLEYKHRNNLTTILDTIIARNIQIA